MPPDHPTTQRCPVCWTPFPANNPNNPNPRRYCSPACRMEDWRRRHERELTQALLDATLERIRESNAAERERREAARWRHAQNQRRKHE